MSARRPHAKPATRADLEQRLTTLHLKADAIIGYGGGSVPELRRLGKLQDEIDAVKRQLAKTDPPTDPGYVWRECLCADIDPADRPCMVCAAKAERLDQAGR